MPGTSNDDEKRSVMSKGSKIHSQNRASDLRSEGQKILKRNDGAVKSKPQGKDEEN
jgi:hypothetical protein